MTNILIVDDDEIICKILQYRLQLLDFKVDYALTCEQALSRFQGLRPALMIIDIFMPETDGFELLDKLKPQTDKPHIIAISADKRYLRAIELLGANESYSKNDIELIVDAVKRFFSHVVA